MYLPNPFQNSLYAPYIQTYLASLTSQTIRNRFKLNKISQLNYSNAIAFIKKQQELNYNCTLYTKF